MTGEEDVFNKRERRLQVGSRRIVSSVVPSRAEQQGEHGEYGADACRPDAADTCDRGCPLSHTMHGSVEAEIGKVHPDIDSIKETNLWHTHSVLYSDDKDKHFF